MAGRDEETTEAVGRGIALFRIADIQVRLDYSWFLIFALIWGSLSAGYFPRTHPDASTAAYVAAGALATVLFFLSILAHEFSHALVARWSGIRVPAITLFLFGGVSHMEEEARTPGDELRVAAVGPFTSFALAGVFLGLHALIPFGEGSLTGAVVRYLGWINAALGIFNLLPGYPLDGGRVLRAVVWWRTGDLRRATRVAADAGKGLAVGLMILGGLEIFAGALLGGVWLILIGLFLRSMAEGGYQNLVLLQTLEDVSAGDVAVRDVVTVPSGTDVATFVDEYLLGHGFHAFPVADGGTVRGLASVEDVREVPAEKRRSTSVEECMQPLSDELRVAPDVPLARAMKQLARTPGGRLLVMDGDRLVGLLTKSGLARFVEIRRVLDTAA